MQMESSPDQSPKLSNLRVSSGLFDDAKDPVFKTKNTTAEFRTLKNEFMNKTVSAKNHGPVLFGEKGWRHQSLFLPNQ